VKRAIIDDIDPAFSENLSQMSNLPVHHATGKV